MHIILHHVNITSQLVPICFPNDTLVWHAECLQLFREWKYTTKMWQIKRLWQHSNGYNGRWDVFLLKISTPVSFIFSGSGVCSRRVSDPQKLQVLHSQLLLCVCHLNSPLLLPWIRYYWTVHKGNLFFKSTTMVQEMFISCSHKHVFCFAFPIVFNNIYDV